MTTIDIAREIEIEIDIIRERIMELERELYGINRIKDTHKVTAEYYAARTTKIHNEISCLKDIIEDKEQTMDDIRGKLMNMGGLEQKVFYMRSVEGKKLYEIADELGYSHDYIKKLSSALKNEIMRA